MTDSYLNFTNSTLGSKLADALGLPKLIVLERYAIGQAVIRNYSRPWPPLFNPWACKRWRMQSYRNGCPWPTRQA